MLLQLFHKHDSNLNESLNKSVMTYAPKERTYSLSMSLETRVKIVAGIQIIGHVDFLEGGPILFVDHNAIIAQSHIEL